MEYLTNSLVKGRATHVALRRIGDTPAPVATLGEGAVKPEGVYAV